MMRRGLALALVLLAIVAVLPGIAEAWGNRVVVVSPHFVHHPSFFVARPFVVEPFVAVRPFVVTPFVATPFVVAPVVPPVVVHRVWVPGFWSWSGTHWIWVPGHWR
jgi:hypothetical protein